MRTISVSTVLVLLAGLFLASQSGCAPWDKSKQGREFKLPGHRLSPDAVAMELAVAQIEDEDAQQFDEIWQKFDQQKIPLEVRKRLDENGFRVAVVPSQLPAAFARMLEPREIDSSEFDDWQTQLHKGGFLKTVSPLLVHTKVQNRSGEIYPVTTSDVWPQQSWIIRAGDQQTVGSGNNVQGVWTITAFPKGDGSVRLRLAPQIHHGFVRPRIGVGEDGFLFDARQTELKLEEMDFEITIRPGETLVLGPTADLQDLGRLFFRPQKQIKVDDFRRAAPGEAVEIPEKEQRILLIRLVQTQLDELFGWDKYQSE